MRATVGKPYDLSLWATSGGSPVQGIPPQNVTCFLRQPGQYVATQKQVTSLNWKEVQGVAGLYVLVLGANDVPVIGDVDYYIAAAGMTQVSGQVSVEAPSPYAPTAADLCVVSGNVVDLTGNPAITAMMPTVTVRKVGVFATVANSFIAADPIRLYMDQLGNFAVSLLQGTTVVFEIPTCGIKNQLVVPVQPTALLKDLLTPPS